jgi:hypothetical protein
LVYFCFLLRLPEGKQVCKKIIEKVGVAGDLDKKGMQIV